MARLQPLDPAAVAAELRKRWQNGRRAWLDGGGTWPLQVLLHPPTERETVRDLAGVRAWVESWARVASDLASDADRRANPEGPPVPQPESAGDRGPRAATELLWTDRQWPGLGRQRLPERLVFPDADTVADWIGERTVWTRATERARFVRASLDREDLSLGRHFEWLTDASDTDFERVSSAVRWLAEHPDCGLYPRQLPIPGIDTKWLLGNRARVTDLLRQVRGSDGDLWALTGLRREPDLLRLRILDPELRRAFGGLCDISAPVEEIVALPIAPERIFVVENLQTGLAFSDLPGSVVLMARGYAVEVFGDLPWLTDRPCFYWGDLDTHGFAILSRLRQYLPQARSLLMDSDTLLAHRDLWEREEKPAPGPLDGLTVDEQAVFQGLLTDRWGERIRLEQERIDWRYAWARIARSDLSQKPGVTP